MMSRPKQQPIQSRAMLVARGLAATIVALSFIATIVPLGGAPSLGASGLMACCIGKPGHEQGSCDGGQMMEVSSEDQPATEPKPVTDAIGIDEVNTADGHCALHEQSAGDNALVAGEKSEAQKTQAASEESEVETVFASTEETTTEETLLVTIGALTTRCSDECGMCSVSLTRLPRPREHSALPFGARRDLPSLLKFSTRDLQRALALNPKWLRLQPRGPPVLRS